MNTKDKNTRIQGTIITAVALTGYMIANRMLPNKVLIGKLRKEITFKDGFTNGLIDIRPSLPIISGFAMSELYQSTITPSTSVSKTSYKGAITETLPVNPSL